MLVFKVSIKRKKFSMKNSYYQNKAFMLVVEIIVVKVQFRNNY